MLAKITVNGGRFRCNEVCGILRDGYVSRHGIGNYRFVSFDDIVWC